MAEGTLEIPCAKCGNKNPAVLGELPANPHLEITCRRCGATLRFKRVEVRK
ncbi:MAG: hypothetical protein ACREQI_13235 [Candidatus Binataceae bacterium]